MTEYRVLPMSIRRFNTRVALRTFYALLLAAAVIAPRTLFADGPATQVTVLVTDDRNQPVDAAQVILRMGQQIILDTNTDQAGKVVLPVVPAAGYVISVQKKGYVTTQSPLDVTAGPEMTVTVAIAEIELSQQEIVVH